VIQSMLPLHECAAESIADPTATESTAEPLHSIANLAAVGAALTETSCLCVQV
jgi:hypothetical protein